MQSNLTLSLCITCYHKDYNLLECRLKDLQQQTCSPDEIIISSSGLEQQSCAYVINYTINQKHIPFIYVNRENVGLPGFARNQGGRVSNCDLIMFCDIDDIIHPQKIEIVKHIFNNYNCDMVVHNYSMRQFDGFTEYLGILPAEKITQKELYCTNLLASGPIHHGHITIRTEILKYIKYNENRALGEDGQFCQEVFDSKYNIYYSQHKLIHYNTK